MLAQFIIAIFVLRSGAGYSIFAFISQLARELLGFAEDGVAFLTTPAVSMLTWFFIGVLPAIIFFVSLVSVFYHWRILQWFIGKFATFCMPDPQPFLLNPLPSGADPIILLPKSSGRCASRALRPSSPPRRPLSARARAPC